MSYNTTHELFCMCFLFKVVVCQPYELGLGLLISKAKSLGGLSYKCFTKVYESMVVPVIRYGAAAVWGQEEYSCIDAVHKYRYFLIVNKYTPSAAVKGDIGVRVPMATSECGNSNTMV